MVHFLPIEPLEERYSAQMLRWVIETLVSLGIPYRVYQPYGYDAINSGQWLDTYGTTIYRSQQISQLARAFSSGEVNHGDVILLGDVWYPGIEAVKQMAELEDKRVYVYGWHHAGCFDYADLLATKLAPWAPAWERWLLGHYLDGICVGSLFHKQFLLANATPKVMGIGQVWRPDEVRGLVESVPIADRENIVVFSHRYAPEKNPEAFYGLARKHASSTWSFVMSTNNPKVGWQMEQDIRDRALENKVRVVVHDSKLAYYRFISRSKIFYSAAWQETFGYSLHEAMALGLHIVAPRRLAYREALHGDVQWLYVRGDGESYLLKAMANPQSVPYEYTAAFDRTDVPFITRIVEDAEVRSQE